MTTPNDKYSAALEAVKQWREIALIHPSLSRWLPIYDTFDELLQPSPPVADGEVDDAVKYLRAEMAKGFYSMKEDQDAIEILIRAAQHPQREEFTDELIDLLHIMWDGYKNGTPAYEYDFDNSPGGFLGNAFHIEDVKETRICEILNKYRPVKTLPSPPKAEK